MISIKPLSSEEKFHTANFLRISTRHGNVQFHTVPFQAVLFHLCEYLEIVQKTEFVGVLIRLFKLCRSVTRTRFSMTRKYCLKIFFWRILYHIFVFFLLFSNISLNFDSTSISEVIYISAALAEANPVWNFL